MSREVFCQKLQKVSEGLEIKPYPGELGERIYNNISREAWQQWLNHQTLLINEYRLSMLDPKARELLLNELTNFLFGTESATPPGYQPGPPEK